MSAEPSAWVASRRQRVDQIMRLGIEQGVFPGGVVLVSHRRDIVIDASYGHSFTHRDLRTVSPNPVTTRLDTIYDLASITKLFTATCVMRLVNGQTIRLDDPVATFLPGFAVNGKADVTVRQLLTHVAGLPQLRLWDVAGGVEERRRRVLTGRPDFCPGTAMTYHDTNFIVLGQLIEAVTGVGLDQAMNERVLRPLGLRDTRYGPIPDAAGAVAATEDESCVGRGMLVGDVHDENAWALGGVAGHAGLFGTARDLCVFARMYLDGGMSDGTTVLAPETVTRMTRDQTGLGGARGLGWQLDAAHYMGGLASPQTFGHTGFTGTSLVIDPRRDLVVVMLTNRVHPTRNGPPLNPVRRAVADAVLAALPIT